MAPREEVIRKIVGQWIGKAEDDFDDAGILLSHKPRGFGAVAFHSRQCAEKYLKAFLTARQVDLPKTHDIGEILDLVATKDEALAGSLRDATALNPYGVEIRYPSDVADVSPEVAGEALGLASKVRDAVREALGDFVGEKGEGAEGGKT